MDYKYRFMRGGFGLAANISAHTEECEYAPSNTIQINQGLHLRLPVDHIHWKDAAWLSFGLSLHSANLSRNDGSHLLVAIDSFTYPGADYQAEVAALAIDGWVHQNLSIPPCGVSVSYERPRRRFCFDWGPDVVPFCDALPG
ncbi:hypothetical protein [Streptomyces sp. NBC_01408]|uniref:hypothetical protein n=1 Tax=Streptomyces sp. NBC_01408 TaxID=2903855 RepID=UPI002253DA3D|nr:hypothetical protein [Streptomyces sp. NBC_01408]MCX4692680.1 hypothetical protein [Streptomyces sp. NBC_01408]